MATEIDSLQIRIVSNGENAANAINQVSGAVKSLSAGKRANQTVEFLRQLSDTMARVRSASTAASAIQTLANGVQSLKGVGSLTKAVNNISAIAPAINALHSADLTGVSDKMSTLAQAMSHISGLKGLTSFGTAMRSLKDLPNITEKLTPEVLSDFADRVQRVSEAVTPLSTKMTAVKAGFQAINGPIRQASESTKDFSSAISNINVAAIISNLKTGYYFIRRILEGVMKLTDDVVDFDGIVERFKRGFGDTAGEAYSWIQRLNKEMGLNVQQFMQYTSIFAQMLEGLGVAQKDATQMAIGYSELSYDIWAAYNDIFESYGDAVSAVQSAIAGQTRPLRRAGFSVLNTTLQQTAANHGLEISITKATEAEKSYLRYLSLVDQAQEQGIIGTYAKEMETAEGQLRTLGQMFKSLTQEAGKLLLPLLTVVVPRVQAAVKLITEAIQRLAALFGVTLKTPEWSNSSGFAEAVEDAEDAAEGIESAMGGAAGSAKELKKTLLGIDEINQLNGANGGSGGGGGGGGSSVVDALNGYDWDVSSLWTDAIFKNINSQVDEIAQKIKDFIPTLEWIAAGVAGISLATMLADAEKLATVFKTLGEVLLNVGLNVAFTEVVLRTDLSTNPAQALLGLIAEWVASAGTGLMMAKTLGLTNKQGMGIGFAIGAGVQIIVTAIELATGTVDFKSKNFWIQTLSSTLMGGVAGMMLMGGPQGFLLGISAAVTLELLSFAIAWKNGAAAQQGLKEAFGEGMGLTGDELRMYVNNVIVTPRHITVDGETYSMAQAVEMNASLKLNIEKSIEDINSSFSAIEQGVMKLKLGVTTDPETLRSDIENYVKSVQSFIDNTYQQGVLSLSVLNMQNSGLMDYLNDWYSNGKLSNLNRMLNEVLTQGTMTSELGITFVVPEEQRMYAALELSKQIHEIVNEAAMREYEAKLTGLKLRTQGTLSGEEILEAIRIYQEEIATGEYKLYSDSMDKAIEYALGEMEKNIAEGMSEAQARLIYNDELQQAYSEWGKKVLATNADILNYGMDLLKNGFSEYYPLIQTEYDRMLSELDEHEKSNVKEIERVLKGAFERMNKEIPDDARAAMLAIVTALEPSMDETQRIADTYQAAGIQMDQSLVDGLNDYNMKAAILGVEDALLYMSGYEFSQSRQFFTMLETTENAFAKVDEAAKNGIANNVQLVYDEVSGAVIGVQDVLTDDVIAITPTVRENLEALGIVIPEALLEGSKEGTETYIAGANGVGAQLYSAVGISLSDKFLSDNFKKYGQTIPNGVKSGATTTPSWFTPTVQSYQTDIQTAFRTYMSEKEWVKYGQAVPGGVKSGMGNGSDLNSHASWLLKNINPNMDEAVRGMKNIGGNLVKGILQGMETESSSTQTKQSLGRVMTNLDTHTRVKALIGSPSKLFAEDVGYWLTAGIVEGMNQPYALIEPMEVMYTNAKDWWDSNTTDIIGGDFEFIDESGKNHYMDIKDANNEQNSLLKEQNALLRAILEKESTGGYYGTTGEAMLEAASHLNRRTGRTMIPVGG